MTSALDKLAAAQRRTASVLSAGLEPCAEHLFSGATADPAGHRACLRAIIHAAHPHACAFKLNLAFFEALGPDGWSLLHEVRRMIPDDAFVIADAKRSDIGSSAERYALALFDQLGVDAVTVNPLLGRDACEPFLRRATKMTFLLALTSNPGADDFLLRDGLWERIIERSLQWTDAPNIGFVVGATRPQHLARARELAGAAPFLIPGVGAQGGDPSALRPARIAGSGFGGVIVHATRALLPQPGDGDDPRAAIESKAERLKGELAKALG